MKYTFCVYKRARVRVCTHTYTHTHTNTHRHTPTRNVNPIVQPSGGILWVKLMPAVL